MSISAFNAEAQKAFERRKEMHSIGGGCVLDPEDHRQWLSQKMRDIGIEIVPDDELRQKSGEAPSTSFAETQAIAPDVLANAVAKARAA